MNFIRHKTNGMPKTFVRYITNSYDIKDVIYVQCFLFPFVDRFYYPITCSTSLTMYLLRSYRMSSIPWQTYQVVNARLNII